MTEKKIDKYLMTEAKRKSSVYELETPEIRKLVSMVGNKLDYSIEDVYCFVLHLLEDVNAHSVVPKVMNIFDDDLK